MDLVALKAELDAGHPDTGAYNASDSLAADELNAQNRPADGSISEVVKYVSEQKSRSNNGTDTRAQYITYRLDLVAAASPSQDVFGSGNNLQPKEIEAAIAFRKIIESPQLEAINFVTTEISGMLEDLRAAQIMKAADVTAIKAVSSDQQSRAQEIGLGVVRVGHVTEARALP